MQSLPFLSRHKSGFTTLKVGTLFGFWLPFVIVTLWFLLAVGGPLFYLHPNEIHLDKILLPSDNSALFGYDDLGRYLADRVIVGAQTSLTVALSVVLISATLGTSIGMVSAYYGGWLDTVVVFIIDVFLAFPGILLAIALAGLMGPGIENVVLALSIVGWVGFARLARAQVFTIKEREHIMAAQALGTGSAKILIKHILPLVFAPLIIEASFGVASIIIAEAGLSFLGLGVQPPQASWGSMIRDGARYLLVAPHMVLVPGVALALVVLAVNLLGDRLRDYLDVRGRLYAKHQL